MQQIGVKWWLAVAAAPLIAWLLAAALNPSGWASDSPVIVLLFIYIVMEYWYIAVPVAAILLYLMVKRNLWGFVAWSMLVGLYTCLIFFSVVTAEEDEFA